MSFEWEQELADHGRDSACRAGHARVLERMGGFHADETMEAVIIERQRDPKAWDEFVDRDPKAYLRLELAIYEVSRDAAIAVGQFDPAAYRREHPDLSFSLTSGSSSGSKGPK